MSTPEIQALQLQILELQRQVSSLQAVAGQPGEQLTPYYLTVSPTGVITANFSGVFTGSLQLPEAQSNSLPYSPQSAITWIDAGGVIRESIAGTITPTAGEHALNLTSEAQASPLNQASIYLTSLLGGGVLGYPGSRAFVQLNDSGPGYGAQHATILDSSGASDFVQKVSNFNNTPSPQQSATPWFRPPSPYDCFVNCHISGGPNPTVVWLSGRCNVDMQGSSTGSGAIAAGIWHTITDTSGNVLSNNLVYNILGNNPSGGGAGGYVYAIGPTNVADFDTLFATQSTSTNQTGLAVFGTSGSGDFSGIATDAGMAVGEPIAISIPQSANDRTVQFFWVFGGTAVSGVLWATISQALSAIY